MTDTDKKKGSVLDGLKKILTNESTKKETTTPARTTKTTAKPATRATASKPSATIKYNVQKDELLNPKIKAEQDIKKQKEVLKSKKHQDLINVAYKAAEKLKIAPWVLLRAAGWGNFTDDRGKKYDGPAIDEIKGLDDTQKKALKEELGL